MQRAWAFIATVAIVAAYAASAVAESSQPSTPSTRQEPTWLARTFLPSAENRLGEVRVSVAPRGLRIRTLLYSNLLKRVVGEIEMKSEAGWPDGSRYREDSRRYVALLRAAREEVWNRWRNLGNRERLERTQNLVIDFVITPARTAIDVGIPEWREADGDKRIGAVEPLGDGPFDSGFVRAEAVRILEDQFPARAKELVAMLPPAAAQ